MHVVTSFRRNLGDLIRSGTHAGPAHEGNSRTMGMHADEKSDGCIVPVKPRTMPSDIGGGDGGGKAAGQGEGELRRMLRTQRWKRHVTEAASPRIGAVWVPNTPKADHVRPETGAGCGKAARRDLRGGRGAILVPTATIHGCDRQEQRVAQLGMSGRAVALGALAGSGPRIFAGDPPSILCRWNSEHSFEGAVERRLGFVAHIGSQLQHRLACGLQ